MHLVQLGSSATGGIYMRYIHFICVCFIVLLILGANPPDSAPDTGEEPAPPPCCGGVGERWNATRMVDGVAVDQVWLIPVEGQWVECAFASHSANQAEGRLAAFLAPLKSGAKGVAWVPGKRYYDGYIPGVGRIIAQQLDENESWSFEYRGYEITDSEGFVYGGKLKLRVTSELPGRWNETWDEVEFSNGVWATVNCTGQIDFAAGSSGLQREELQPEYQEMLFIELPIPGMVGHFLGRCHEVGEIWTVTIDGKTYTATVTDKDPKAHPLDQPPAPPPGGPPPSSK